MKRTVLALLVLALAAPVLAQTADNSRVPPLTTITAADGGVFTRVGSDIYRNGVTTYGAGSQLLMWKGVAYVFGDDKQWYQYIGGASWPWVAIGTVDPSGGPVNVPVIPVVPSANNKLAWTMVGTTTTVIAAGSFKLYVDSAAGVVVANRVCATAGTNVDCTIPLPTLSLGEHILSMTYLDAKKVESIKSASVRVLISATLVPSALRLQ